MAQKSPLQCRVEYIIARLFFGVLGFLPRGVSIRLGIIVVRLIFAPLIKIKRIGMLNLSIAFPEMTNAQRRKILKKSFSNLGRTISELTQFPRATPERLAELVTFKFDDREDHKSLYREEKKKGRGTIFAGPHLGNWEIGIFSYSAMVESVDYLARPLDNPLIDEYLNGIRNRFGNRAINKRQSFQTIIEILRAGGTLGVMPDVNVQSKDGVFVPFFGKLACTTGGVAMLAKRTDAMILPMCSVWDPATGKYVVKYDEVILSADTGDRERDVIETTAAMTAAMERFIRAHPDQWLWVHKRWKTRPPGEDNLYADI